MKVKKEIMKSLKCLLALMVSSIVFSGAVSAQTTSFTAQEVCRAGIGTVMGRDVAKIKAKTVKDEIIVNYIRPSDGDKFQYKCVLPPGGQIVWAAWIDGKWGRWRDTPADGKLTYAEDSGTLVVTDGSYGAEGIVEKYKKSDFVSK